mmetsp:Transcript_3857/g.12471  ORF Transcript_3857/g.12471 Transcript_3857/m.12471 type:complete len:307 (+) Transcript_3857:273-1193(+)
MRRQKNRPCHSLFHRPSSHRQRYRPLLLPNSSLQPTTTPHHPPLPPLLPLPLPLPPPYHHPSHLPRLPSSVPIQLAVPLQPADHVRCRSHSRCAPRLSSPWALLTLPVARSSQSLVCSPSPDSALAPPPHPPSSHHPLLTRLSTLTGLRPCTAHESTPRLPSAVSSLLSVLPAIGAPSSSSASFAPTRAPPPPTCPTTPTPPTVTPKPPSPPRPSRSSRLPVAFGNPLGGACCALATCSSRPRLYAGRTEPSSSTCQSTPSSARDSPTTFAWTLAYVNSTRVPSTHPLGRSPSRCASARVSTLPTP